MHNRSNIVASVFSDKGQTKELNEDNFFFNGDILDSFNQSSFDKECIFEDGEGIFVVCDGMGGDGFGQKASKEVAENFKEHVKTIDRFGNVEHYVNRINVFISDINDKIFKMAVHYPDLKGMGTTFTSLIIKNRKAVALNVGDSRVYHYRAGVLKQLTVDHTEAQRMHRLGIITKEEAKRHIKRYIVSRYIGLSPLEGKLEGESSQQIDIENGDYFLICSNSLNELIDERKMLEIIDSNPIIGDLKKGLLKECIDNDGKDNITFIVLKIQTEANGVMEAADASSLKSNGIVRSISSIGSSMSSDLGNNLKKYNTKKIFMVGAACFGLILMSYVLTFLFGKIGGYMKNAQNKSSVVTSKNPVTSNSSEPGGSKSQTAQNSYISPVATPFISPAISADGDSKSTPTPMITAVVQPTKAPQNNVTVVRSPVVKPTEAPKVVPSPTSESSRATETATGDWGKIVDIAKGDVKGKPVAEDVESTTAPSKAPASSSSSPQNSPDANNKDTTGTDKDTTAQ